MRLSEGKFWLSVVLIGVSLRGAAAHTLQSAEIAAGEVSKTAVRAATGTVTVVNIPWSFPSNRIDWLFNPTAKKGPFNPEWTWQLNRMFFWEDLAKAYRATKDEKYARAFVVQLRDWLDQTGGVPAEKGYNGVGSPWRTIEEGLRLMYAWPTAEDGFRDSPAFTPELKRRFVAAMYAQAKHLMAHRTCRNWLLMEMTGAYTFATRHPEFSESEGWRRESARIFADEIRRQVLPDGMQLELSPDYHLVFFSCASKLYRLAKARGFEKELPKDYLDVLARGAQAVLDLTTPSFVQPRFNDCYTIRAEWVLASAAEFFPKRTDFRWVATGRREGAPPAGETASRLLPWSGFAAMRSDWGPDASYVAFDFGPLGAAHYHQDKLSFTFWKGGEELVFDDGGGQYDVSAYRAYALTGYGHNTLLVDGLAQNRKGPLRVDAPIDAGWTTTASRDVVRGAYDDGFGPKRAKLARHVREIAFEKAQDLVLVTDTVWSADGKEHDYELLFHVDTTNVTVAADGRSVRARFGRKWDLRLTVREGGTISTASGVLKPRLSGWFVGRNDMNVHLATTISVKAPASVRNHRFVTELVPVRGVRK